MSQTSDRTTGPRLSEDGKARVDDRRAKQAEALRANLRRRKEQLRARAEAGEDLQAPDDLTEDRDPEAGAEVLPRS